MMRIGRFEYDISSESLLVVRTVEQVAECSACWNLQTPSEEVLTAEVSRLRDALWAALEERDRYKTVVEWTANQRCPGCSLECIEGGVRFCGVFQAYLMLEGGPRKEGR